MAARATPVWGQLKRPVRSALAAAFASSSSEASSTTPLKRWRTFMAFFMLTGSPI